ncbi:Nuclear pore complex protein Nup85 [Mycena indigotica]|uniref:Nuclear pore complex protein Nup85 n=1 Tax=Mycena indigotica TaxID=2126181 RepID=A0A8H6WCJ2_9AGAR|nr:Nuclear pore complex protein Nup85 [Mycena indigotica]KAF7309813.1 Nuclear pore complex protein Nup85 [Mycena indigotica]
MSGEHFNLTPPLVPARRSQDLLEAGQAISASLSPFDNSISVFATNAVQLVHSNSRIHSTYFQHASQPTKRPSDEEQPIYFSNIDAVPSSERRLFITDTLVIFAAFQNLLKSAKTKDPDWMQNDDNLTVMRKLSIDYVNFIKECWIHASHDIPRPEGPLQFSADHYRSLYTCFSLFVVLYLPEPGYEEAPVGEDLMEWLNIHFIEPSTEEGDHLSSLQAPWEDDSFWPYLTRHLIISRATLRGLSKASVFFFNTLSEHPSVDLRDLAEKIAAIIASQPRLQNFAAEKDFASASRRWKDQVKAIRVEMEQIPEGERFDEFDNWWDRLSDIVGVLEGRGEMVERICAELGADWKEVCAAWGVFVEPRLRRQELPEVVERILDSLPPDPTNLEDMVHTTLLSGKPLDALLHASQLDRWLSAHLADIMEPLSLLTGLEEDGISVRDEHILAYADYLHSDPALWRITVEYMYSCGDVGKERGDQVLIRVPLRLQAKGEQAEEGQIHAGNVVGVLKDVNQTCFDYKREAARRTVCRIAAQSFVREKDYGLAVSYCCSAEDWQGLGRVVDCLLEEYIASGPASFAQYASDIAPSLQNLGSQQAISHGVFIHRLMFAVRYSNFQQLRTKYDQSQNAALDLVAMLRDHIAPKSWWAVLLCDAIDLLQNPSMLLFSTAGAAELLNKLEEIFTRSAQGDGADYLDILARTIRGGGHKEALERLKTVRLALAKYFARSAVLSP